MCDQTATEMKIPLELLKKVKDLGKLPVPNFSAGGIATPADAALMMHLGAEAVFVGSGIFKSENPSERAKSIVKAVTPKSVPPKPVSNPRDNYKKSNKSVVKRLFDIIKNIFGSKQKKKYTKNNNRRYSKGNYKYNKYKSFNKKKNYSNRNSNNKKNSNNINTNGNAKVCY